MFAKRKEQKLSPPPDFSRLTAAELIDLLRAVHVAGSDLRALVELTQRLIADDLERRVAVQKASRDGRGLPIEVIRRDLMKHHKCPCEGALAWPDE